MKLGGALVLAGLLGLAAGGEPASNEIPSDRWLAIPHGPGAMGWNGAAVELKHTWAEPGPNDRVYFHGGDYPGGGHNQSYRQDLWSFDLAEALQGRPGAGWRLEHPYCAPPPDVQPKHPDKVSIAWDGGRRVFWAFPGAYDVSTEPQDLCEGETPRRASDPRFPWNEVLFWTPTTAKWTIFDTDPGPGFTPNRSGGRENAEGSSYSVYDPASDSLVRFGRDGNGLRAVHYHIATKRYTRSGYLHDGTSDIRINQNYLAYDPAERVIYVIDGISARLYRYDVAAKTIERVTSIPGGPFPPSAEEWPLARFDTRHRVILFHRRYPPRGFFAYDVAARNWRTLSLATNLPGVEADGLVLWYDPSRDYVGLMGGTPLKKDAAGRPTGIPTGTRYMFVTRYQPGATPPVSGTPGTR